MFRGGGAKEIDLRNGTRQSDRRGILLALGCAGIGIACLIGLLSPVAALAAPPAPVWQLSITAQPTNLIPGAASGSQGLFVTATNVGGAPTSGPISIVDELPAGLTPGPGQCNALGQLFSCTFTEVVDPGEEIIAFIPVSVSSAVYGQVLKDDVTVSGGGDTATASVETRVGAPAPSFGFLPGSSGLGARLNGPDGAAVAKAGSTPYQLTFDVGFPSQLLREGSAFELAGSAHPRDLAVELPPGLVIDPTATPRCRQPQLELGTCPLASQVGRIAVTVTLTASSPPTRKSSPLYNMVPPPGAASNLGFDLAELGAEGHLLGSLRAGGNRLSGTVTDLLANHPVLGVQLQLWGDPSDPAHDAVRGGPVEPQASPFVALPSACGPVELTLRADSWESSGSFVSRSAPLEDLSGAPIEVEECSLLEFDPSLAVEPSTGTADSPSGLSVSIAVPQQLDQTGSKASSLKRVEITLPPGMAINPSTANGRTGCGPAQIGLTTAVGQTHARFDDSPAACPDAAKLGTVEALTPLLQDGLETGGQVARPLHGSIYLAQPGQNPFGSLFALYATIEDPDTGIAVKLAGEISADSLTGQLTTVFDAIPQLPFEEFALDFFAGPRGLFRTPSICGVSSARALLTPWSGTPPVQEGAVVSIAASPDGGPCATAPGRRPHLPRFGAESTLPAAGGHSPFVLNLSRRDGSQELDSLNLTLPPGLVGRIGDTPDCPEADLSAAASRSGSEERAMPSCPAASRVGRVVAGLGAGSTPYHAEGEAYLAGPYRGAPFSLAVVVPAVAGPFDLGAVVVRVALFVDEKSGRVSAKSDSLPTILSGVPLDIRSLVLELTKPDLIVNPTSCEAMSVSGEAISTSGDVAPLHSRFQVDGCGTLPFRPKLSVRLIGSTTRGAHPKIRATLRPGGGSAGLKRIFVSLPASELLDPKRIGAVCGLPAADIKNCPSRAAVAHLEIHTPLLSTPLAGPVFLRPSKERLPGLTAVLDGAIQLHLSGRLGAANGRVQVGFDQLPDIPFEELTLRIVGGRNGILVNSGGVCSGSRRLKAKLRSHSGRIRTTRPRLGARCPVD